MSFIGIWSRKSQVVSRYLEQVKNNVDFEEWPNLNVEMVTFAVMGLENEDCSEDLAARMQKKEIEIN